MNTQSQILSMTITFNKDAVQDNKQANVNKDFYAKKCIDKLSKNPRDMEKTSLKKTPLDWSLFQKQMLRMKML